MKKSALLKPLIAIITFTLSIPLANAQSELHLFTLKIAPYFFMDENRKRSGSAIDFYQQLMKKLSIPEQKVKTMPGKRLQTIMNEGKNIILFPLVYKPEREAFLDYLYHTHSSSLNFVGYGKSTLPEYLINFDSSAIPENLKIGVDRGTIFEIILRNNHSSS